MTNGERIRSMSDEELNTFLWRFILWWFKIDALSAFLSKGGAGVMDAEEQRLWLQSQDNTFLEALMKHSEE